MTEDLDTRSLSDKAQWPHEKAYRKYLNAGGVFDISVCNNVSDDLTNHRAVLLHALGNVDLREFEKVAPFEIAESTFHGKIYDFETGNFFYPGTLWFGGKKKVNPTYRDIKWVPKGFSVGFPEVFSQGGFANAFCDLPYPLQLSHPEKQTLYEAITSAMAPRNNTRILNWHQDALVKACPALRCGEEWWGVYAFTTYNKLTSQVFAAVAATTDQKSSNLQISATTFSSIQTFATICQPFSPFSIDR